MNKPLTQLLIVDDNLELCDILNTFFELTPEITVCGVAHNGEDALASIAQIQPDIVLLDLIMPKTDGIAVLERLQQAKLNHRPKVIVTSAIGQEGVTTTALALGADYYMIKPYDLYALRSRIQLVASMYQESLPTSTSTENLVSRLLLEMAIPTHMLGYRYCATAIEFLLHEDKPLPLLRKSMGRFLSGLEPRLPA